MHEITAKELNQRLHENLQIIDVRERDEVVSGMIEGAKNLPLSQFVDRFIEIDNERPVILVCRSGNRSGQAQIFLTSQGYSAVNLIGGMIDWLDADFPVVLNNGEAV